MTDELALRRSADRAAKAEALLRDELLIEAFAALRQSYLAAWETTALRDTEGRERAWMAVTLLGKVKGHLDTVVMDGKISSVELAEIEAKAKRQRRA